MILQVNPAHVDGKAAAVYLRVSSKDGRQDEENQRPDCERLCAARGWVAVPFVERESGAKARPVWAALVEAARRGEVGAVVFWALDRVGRTRVQVAHDVAELGRFGVHIASVQDAWLDQPPGPLRDLLVQIMAWVAEGERRRLIERTKAGQARARALGKRIGRPPIPAETMRKLARAHEGLARTTPARSLPAAIARATGVPRGTVRTWLAKSGAVLRPGKPTEIRGL